MGLNEKENIASMAITSLSISIILAIIISFANYASANINNPENTIGTNGNNVWAGTLGTVGIVNNLDNYKPDNLTCAPGTTNCTEGISSETALQNTGFDPLQAYIQIKRILGVFIQILALTVFAPIYIGLTLGTLISNPFISFIIGIFGFLWQILNVWLVIQIFIKK